MTAWIQYYVRVDQMRFGMLQATTEPEVKRAVTEGEKEYLRALMGG
jgi:desulfoferrodoxin (superoxide reductase-like protein)